MTMKRMTEDREVEEFAMANCLMILTSMAKSSNTSSTTTTTTGAPGRIFTCKTCNRQFSSFQALGGHRASHKRPRLLMAAENPDHHHRISIPAKPRRHECSICGIDFAVGQALGGHMSRHRNDHHDIAAAAASHTHSDCTTETTLDSSQKAHSGDASSRVLWLDLNLTPHENDMKFGKLDSSTLI